MVILGTITVMLLLMALRGIVIQDMFNWFVSPAFQVDNIGFWLALGLSATVALMTHDFSQESDKSKNIADPFVKGIIVNLVFWGFGWIYQSMI